LQLGCLQWTMFRCLAILFSNNSSIQYIHVPVLWSWSSWKSYGCERRLAWPQSDCTDDVPSVYSGWIAGSTARPTRCQGFQTVSDSSAECGRSACRADRWGSAESRRRSSDRPCSRSGSRRAPVWTCTSEFPSRQLAVSACAMWKISKKKTWIYTAHFCDCAGLWAQEALFIPLEKLLLYWKVKHQVYVVLCCF